MEDDEEEEERRMAQKVEMEKEEKEKEKDGRKVEIEDSVGHEVTFAGRFTDSIVISQ